MQKHKSDLIGMTAFVAVGEALSFTQAAKKIGTTKGTISKRLNKYEKQLGKQLLARTTRRAALTEAGAFLLPKIRDSLDQIRQAEAAAQHLGG